MPCTTTELMWYRKGTVKARGVLGIPLELVGLMVSPVVLITQRVKLKNEKEALKNYL